MRLTCLPAGPVWCVTSVLPSILLGFLGGLLDRLGQAHAALLAGVGLLERALAAAACVDLRLDDPERTVELAGGGLGLLGAENDAAVRDRRAVVAQKRLA